MQWRSRAEYRTLQLLPLPAIIAMAAQDWFSWRLFGLVPLKSFLALETDASFPTIHLCYFILCHEIRSPSSLLVCLDVDPLLMTVRPRMRDFESHILESDLRQVLDDELCLLYPDIVC